MACILGTYGTDSLCRGLTESKVMRSLQLPPEAWLRLRGDNTNITEPLGCGPWSTCYEHVFAKEGIFFRSYFLLVWVLCFLFSCRLLGFSTLVVASVALWLFWLQWVFGFLRLVCS